MLFVHTKYFNTFPNIYMCTDRKHPYRSPLPSDPSKYGNRYKPPSYYNQQDLWQYRVLENLS